MDPAIEQRFWKRIGVSSLHDLADFPFGGHQDFVIAVRRGEVTFGITPGIAREYTEAMAVGLPRIAYLLLACVPFLLVPVTIGLAVYTERWAMLTGVLACLIPIILASPNNPNKNLVLLASFAALAYAAYAWTLLTLGAWIAFTFGISVFAIRSLNWWAAKQVRTGVLESEALTAYFWTRRALYMYAKGSRILYSKVEPPDATSRTDTT